MKRNSFFLMAIICATIFCSCNNGADSNTTTDSSTTMTTTTDNNDGAMAADNNAMTSSGAPLEEMDKEFMLKAAAGGMMEVELGNYAQQNAASQRVKDFGAMMVSDHGKANDELKSIAANHSLMLDQDSLMNTKKAEMDKLKQKTGRAFDVAYMDMMVTDHKKDISEFEKASKMCKDQQCLAFASKTLPVLQMHLDSAQAINGSIK